MMTIPEAAAYLNVSQRTVRKLIGSELVAARVGKSVLITDESLAAFVERLRLVEDVRA